MGNAAETPALLHVTSGTTGTPKGALHVHEAVVAHHATAAHANDSSTCGHEYIPCAPSGFQITVIHVDRPAMIAIDRRLWASAATTASGQV